MSAGRIAILGVTRDLHHGLLVLLTAALLVAPALTVSQRQTAPPPAQPTFRATVDLVEVTVSVTDEDGNAVRDLTADDVDVYEDGEVQPILTFGHVDVPQERFETSASRPTSARSDVASNAQRAREGRVYLLLLDDLHTNPLRSAEAQAIGRQFIEHNLFANDLMAVAVTSGLTPSQPFTGDRRRLLQAVDRFIGRDEPEPGGIRSSWHGPSQAPTVGFGAPPSATSIAAFTHLPPILEEARSKQAWNTRQMLRTLEEWAEWMGSLDTRREAIILVGQGIDYDTTDLFGHPDAIALLDETTQAARAAARHDVTVYAIDPRGLPTGEPSSIPTRHLVAENPFSSDEWRAKQSLHRLTEESGGFAFINSNQFGQAFERIVRDNSAYYLLGYRPPRETPDDELHQIRVRVNRSDVVVRARRSYVDTRAPTGLSGSDDIATQLATVLNSPLPQWGLRLDLVGVPFRGDDDGTAVVVAVRVSTPDRPGDPGGSVGDDVVVAVVATDANGNVLAHRTVEAGLSPEVPAETDARGPLVLVRLELPSTPVPVQMRAAAIDRTTGARGSVHHELDIPNFHAGALAMSGVAIGASLAGQVATATSDVRLTPRRVFTSNDTLEVFTEIYLNGSSTRRHLDIACTIRSATGTVWFRTQEERSTEEAVAVYRASFPLWDLPAGAYILAVDARDDEGGPPVGRQVPFTVALR